MQRRTEITIETERLLVVSRRSETNILSCKPCARNVPMLTAEEVAATFNLDQSKQLHFGVTADGRLMICSYSLGLETSGDGAREEGPTSGQNFDRKLGDQRPEPIRDSAGSAFT